MKQYVYNNKPQTLCYGCRACEQICAHKAVVMVENDEGFIYPQVDSAKCVDCGLCEKVCPTQDESINKILNSPQTKCFAAWNKNLDDRLKSTSGGLFYLIARTFIESGGVVYGVGMNEKLLAYHYRVDKTSDLQAFRGSKYIQSDVNTTFTKVKIDLDNGLKVLYSGTPCQIAGLRLFLRKDYPELNTIDLVCHGVPSPMIFGEHLKYLESKYNNKIENFLFRGKKRSGWRAYVTYVMSGGKRKFVLSGEDFFLTTFYAGNFNRKSCFVCEYSRLERCGDVTLSDFWGGENFVKRLKLERKHGYNLVICNTDKGHKLFESVGSLVNSVDMDITAAVNGDVRLRHAEPETDIRNVIFKEFQEKGYNYIVDKYGRKPTLKRYLRPNWLKNLIRELQARI